MPKKTNVYLVGAGPGDPSLITVKGKHVLAKADVVLYDQLANEGLLIYCKPKAVCISVGKAKGKHSKKQTEINKLIKTYASKGKIVVRLKGGDPYVFGRGGEETDLLLKHDIPFEIVPGVTSALGVPAYGGIPITHRKHSRTFSVLTGTLEKDKSIETLVIPQVDTLIILMGVTHLERLATKISNSKGFSKKTPVAILYRGTTSNQRVISGTLSTISNVVKDEKLRPPAIVVVGEVAKEAKERGWVNNLPLFGKRLIIARTQEQNQELLEQLSCLGADVVVHSELAIVSQKKEQEKLTAGYLKNFSSIILTSQHGVRCVIEALLNAKTDIRALSHLNIVCVGPKTKAALNTYGIQPDGMPKKFESKYIIECFEKDLKKERICMPIASNADPYLQNELKIRGAKVDVIPIYKSSYKKIVKGYEPKDDDYVVAMSSSFVEHFFKKETKKAYKGLCIGEKTAREWEKCSGLKAQVSKNGSLGFMLKLIL